MFDKTLLKEGLWTGRRCFVVGGGPSLKDFDWSRLEGELVIGTNRSFEQFEPSVMISMDKRFYQWVMWGEYGEVAKERYRRLVCEKVLVRSGRIDTDFFGEVTLVRRAGLEKIGRTFEDGISHGSNSGTCGINLGILLGASEIYLLGFDMKDSKSGETHYHDGHPAQPKNGKESHYKRFMRYLEKLGPQMQQCAKIVNLNPDSALEVFEKGTIEELKPLQKRPLVVCFYTDVHYQVEAERMAHSARLFGLEYELTKVESAKDWNRNAYKKAAFMLEKLKEHDRPIVWVDADARVRRYPWELDAFASNDSDMAVCYVDWANNPQAKRNDKELISAVVGLKPTKGTFEILEAWVERNKETYGSRKFEQLNLDEVIKENPKVAKVELLPEGYCHVFDKSIGEPIIEQMQASRRARKGLLNVDYSTQNEKHILITGFVRGGTSVLANMIHYAYPRYKIPKHRPDADGECSALETMEIDGPTLSKDPKDLFDIVQIVKKSREIGKELYVICLVRDVRDVLTSKHPAKPDDYMISYDDSAFTAVPGLKEFYHWMYILGGMRRVNRVFITYEQLVSDPDMVRELLTAFLREEPERNWLGFWQDQAGLMIKNEERFDKCRGALLKEWIGRWRHTEHRGRILEEFGKHFELRKMLVDLGYEDSDQWYHVMADAYFEEREALAL